MSLKPTYKIGAAQDIKSLSKLCIKQNHMHAFYNLFFICHFKKHTHYMYILLLYILLENFKLQMMQFLKTIKSKFMGIQTFLSTEQTLRIIAGSC